MYPRKDFFLEIGKLVQKRGAPPRRYLSRVPTHRTQHQSAASPGLSPTPVPREPGLRDAQTDTFYRVSPGAEAEHPAAEGAATAPPPALRAGGEGGAGRVQGVLPDPPPPPPGAAGDSGSAAAPTGAGGQQGLPTSRDRRAQRPELGRARRAAGGGLVASGAARKRAQHPASRDCPPEPAGARLRCPAQARPRWTAQGGRHRRAGGRAAGEVNPARSGLRILPSARGRRSLGEPGRAPTRPRPRPTAHGPRPGPRASRGLPSFRFCHFSPGVIFFWGTTKVGHPSGLNGGQ